MKIGYDVMRRMLLFTSVVALMLPAFGCQRAGQPEKSLGMDIYIIDRDTLHTFLQTPTDESLTSGGMTCAAVEGEQWYIRDDLSRFYVKQELMEFVNDCLKIETYLSQNGIHEKVVKTKVLDAPRVSLTVWVQTEKEHRYITIEQRADEQTYTYTLYTSSEYMRKYDGMDALLLVNGQEVKSACCAKLYADYADVPFLSALKSLGATIVSKTQEHAEILFLKKRYVIHIRDAAVYTEQEENLLEMDGGCVFAYPFGDDMMVDTDTLRAILHEMGAPVLISCDKANNIVSIISDETETIQINSQQNTVTYDIDALPDEETASAVAYQIFVGMKTTHNFVPQKVVYDEGTECWRVSLWEANGDIWTDGEDCTIILQKKDGKMLDIIWGE